MKTKIAALALLLMAGAAPAAFAQDPDQGPRQRPDQTGGERPAAHGDGARQGPRSQPPAAAPTPPGAPEAHAAPTAPQPRAIPGGHWGADPRMNIAPPSAPPPHRDRPPESRPPQDRTRQDRPQDRSGGNGGRGFVRRPGTWVDTEGDDTSQGLNPADRADHEDRQELRDWRRFNGGHDGQPDERRPDARPGESDHRDGGRDHHPDRPRDDHGRPEWRPDAFPHSYHSHERFHVRPYRPPPRFLGHRWGYGEILPPVWFGPEYLIADWWDYDLPAPPPGYDWVRVGDDAVLVDEYTGRIVQVVRGLFW